ncbi:MAG: hypothetical protein WAW86_00615 [Gammaproteobacteria bacterium]
MHGRKNIEVGFLASYLADALNEQDTTAFYDLMVIALRLPKTRKFIFDKQFTYPTIQAQDQLISYIVANPTLVNEDLLELIQDQARFRALPAFQIQRQLLQALYLIEQYQENREARKQQTMLGPIRMYSPSREAFFVEIANLKRLILEINLHYDVDTRARLGQLYTILASLIAAKEKEWLGRTNVDMFTFEEQSNIKEKIDSYKQEIASVFNDIEIIFDDIRKLFAELEEMDLIEQSLIYDVPEEVAPLSQILTVVPPIRLSPHADEEINLIDFRTEKETNPFQRPSEKSSAYLTTNAQELDDLIFEDLPPAYPSLAGSKEEQPPLYEEVMTTRLTASASILTATSSNTMLDSLLSSSSGELNTFRPGFFPSVPVEPVIPSAPTHQIVITEEDQRQLKQRMRG